MPTPITIWTPSSPPNADAGNSNQSNRILCASLSAFPAVNPQFRLTMRGPSGAGNSVFSNISIGKSAGTGAGDITGAFPSTTFQEVLFSGGHGVTIASGVTGIQSDWVNLSITSSDNLVVVLDYGASSTAIFASASNGTEFIMGAPPQYNIASTAGSNNGAFNFNIQFIESQDLGAAVTLMGAICT